MAYLKPLNRVSDVLTQLLKSLSLEKASHQAAIFGVWERAVGSAIAKHAQPEELRADRLFVLVRSSAWIQELTLLKPTLVSNLNSALGENLVGDLVLRLGPSAFNDSPRVS